MNAQAILAKIDEEAREAAATLLREAGERAEAIRAASEERIAKSKEQTLSQAKAEAAALEQRMYRMAQLDERKHLLAAKRQLIDKAFQSALAKMENMPMQTARAFLLSLVKESASGQETLVIGAKHDAWYNPDFLEEANQALIALGKPGQLTAAPEKRTGCTGFLLASSGMEINCTFEALLEAKRLEMEAEVAAILFP